MFIRSSTASSGGLVCGFRLNTARSIAPNEIRTDVSGRETFLHHGRWLSSRFHLVLCGVSTVYGQMVCAFTREQLPQLWFHHSNTVHPISSMDRLPNYVLVAASEGPSTKASSPKDDKPPKGNYSSLTCVAKTPAVFSPISPRTRPPGPLHLRANGRRRAASFADSTLVLRCALTWAAQLWPPLATIM